VRLEILELFGVANLVGPPVVLRRFGVPPGGPFDSGSAKAANALLGNPLDATVIEFGLANARLRAQTAGEIALAGASCEVMLDQARIELPCRVSMFTGQTLQITPPKFGARVYLAGPGGWSAASNKRPIIPLSISAQASLSSANDSAGPEIPPQRTPTESGPIRIVPGPQAPAESEFDWSKGTFTVSHLLDRTGIRLEGPKILPKPELVSEPACPGTIQLTNEGQLVILGPDGPTIGGYPKLACVASVDLHRLGQLRPGDEISFQQIDFKTARDLLVTSKG